LGTGKELRVREQSKLPESPKLTQENWNLYMSPLLMFIPPDSIVPPNTYIESLITAEAWKSRPEGHCESIAGMITDQMWESRSKQ
jgi:hypothetical protein